MEEYRASSWICPPLTGIESASNKKNTRKIMTNEKCDLRFLPKKTENMESRMTIVLFTALAFLLILAGLICLLKQLVDGFCHPEGS